MIISGYQKLRIRVFVWPLLLLLCWSVLLGACGFRNKPKPIREVELSDVRDFRVHLVENKAVSSWWLPSQDLIERHGPVQKYVIFTQRFRLGCVQCPPEDENTRSLTVEDERLHLDGLRAYYAFEIVPAPMLWRVRVGVQYETGAFLLAPWASFKAPVDIPQHTLQSDWVWLPGSKQAQGITSDKEPATKASGPPKQPNKKNGDPPTQFNKLRLFWEPRRDRLDRIIKLGQTPTEREVFFRVNLYAGKENEPWPLMPLNPTPFHGSQWIIHPGETFPVFPPEAKLKFMLRLVDQYGNEGPISNVFVADGWSFYP